MRRRVGLGRLGPWYGLAVVVLQPLAALAASRSWRGVEHVPARGGVILAANHISYVDPVFLAEYVVHGTGRAARFLAKSTLFEGGGLVARVMRGAGQIPVHRDSGDAAVALRHAVAALDAGECVVVYPEGTVTRDPGKWPMRARTGVARLALLTGAPVVPVAQWGAQEIHDSYRRPGCTCCPGTGSWWRPAPRSTCPGGPAASRRGRAARGDRRGDGRRHRPARAAARGAAAGRRARAPARPQVRVTRAAVLGAGSWGTTFAKVLADAGTEVVLWARREELARAVRETHENADYLPGVRLPDAVTATSDALAAVAGADLVVLAVPSHSLRANLAAVVPALAPGVLLVSLVKGVELGTCKRMSEVVREVADVPAGQVAVVSGPNLAREIAAGQPTATVVACTDEHAAARLQEACTNAYFRPYTNPDVIGCELGGAVKNVIALATGMAEGMGFGDNTKASLITRGLAETSRLGLALGADPLTFAGLAGLGDLVATCTSPLSRNRTFGERLGRGEAVAALLAGPHQTAEGVGSCRSVLDLARKHDVDMPITEQVVRVCHEGLAPRDVIGVLMGRRARGEQSDPRGSRPGRDG